MLASFLGCICMERQPQEREEPHIPKPHLCLPLTSFQSLNQQKESEKTEPQSNKRTKRDSRPLPSPTSPSSNLLPQLAVAEFKLNHHFNNVIFPLQICWPFISQHKIWCRAKPDANDAPFVALSKSQPLISHYE